MAGALDVGRVGGFSIIYIEGAEVHGSLPVAGVIHAGDVEVMAVAVGQDRAGVGLNSFLYVLGLVGDGGRAGVPQDRVAVKAAEGVGGVRPVDIYRVVVRPGA